VYNINVKKILIVLFTLIVIVVVLFYPKDLGEKDSKCYGLLTDSGPIDPGLHGGKDWHHYYCFGIPRRWLSR
jgi:hypothetical protein